MREPKTVNENIVYHGWVDATYRKYRAWMRLSFQSDRSEEDQREYRESIGAVKAFRSILETVFCWPSEDLNDIGDEICERVSAEFSNKSQTKRTAPSRMERITPEQGKIYTLRSGGCYICAEVLRDEQPAGAVLRRLSDGYVLKAHGLWSFPDGTIQWDYSTGGHWPDGVRKARMTVGEAVSYLKQYQGYEPIDPETGCRKHAFDLNDETVDTLLTAIALLEKYVSRDSSGNEKNI